MAGPSPKTAGKVSVECPHCGFKQLESVFAKTTYCRKCSGHFSMEKRAQHAPAPPGAQTDSIFSRLARLLQREQIRTIHCFGCQKPQQISSFAKSSICSHCGAYIDLRDFKISSAFNRNIETQGTIAIGSRGEVTSTKIVCGNAIIKGRIHGSLICVGATRVKAKGRVLGSIDSQKLVVEKGSNVEFVRTLKAGTAEINGKMSARINADSVKIGATGVLEGVVHAKSISVEKGGIFHGELFIGHYQPSQQELIPATEAEHLDTGSQGALAMP